MTYALAQLSERERWLLVILGAVVVPVAVVTLAVLPMLDARDAARAEARAALGLRDWVAEQVRNFPQEAVAEAPIGADNPPIGLSGLEDSLRRVGLRDQVTQLANRADGGVDLALEAAEFALLGDWLDAMVPLWGYDLAGFRIEAADPGLVNAEFLLEPRQ
jgi:type II secretory pathway component PulM